MKADLRTGPRFFLNPPIQGLANGAPSRIVDVGAKGVRIEIRNRIEPGSPIEVVFLSLRLRGTVLWCEIDAMNFASDDDFYLAGVAFDVESDEVEDLGLNLLGKGEAIRIVDQRAHDRYRITVPLTGSFGEIAPVSILDLSVAGARIATLERLKPGYAQRLHFQVDDENGPVTVHGTVAWCKPSPVMHEFYAGLDIPSAQELLRAAIDRMCLRGEARIDLDSLKRKFDALRLASRVTENPERLAV